MEVKNLPCHYILAIDPSGNFNEGKGTTGWILLNRKTKKIEKFGEIDASTFSNQEIYWDAHIDLIKQINKRYKHMHLVVEDYLLYAAQANSQINSRMETPKLIGVIQYYAWQNRIPLQFQTASSVQRRWNDYILDRKGYLKSVKHGPGYRHYIGNALVHNHIKDALRHAVHYATFHVKD